MPDQEYKIQITTTADTSGLSDTSKALGNYTDAVKQSAAAELEDKAATTQSSGGKWELRRALEELSRVIPGLGELSGLAAEGFRDMGESELGAAAATDALIMSMGPVAIVILSIQVAVQYWQNYQQSVKDAAAANAEACKKIKEDTAAAFKDWQDFQNALSGNDESASKPYSDELQSRKTIMEARNRQEEEQLRASEAAALEQAATPEEKAAVKDYWEKAAERLKEAQSQEQQGIVSDVIAHIQSDIDARQKQVAGDVAQSHEAYQTMLRSGDRTGYASIQNDLKEQTKAVRELTGLLSGLQSQAQTSGAVAGIDAAGYAEVRQIQDRGQFETGTRALLGDYGNKISASQEDAGQQVRQAFDNVHGSVQIFLDHAKELNRDSAVFKAYVQRELDALKMMMRNSRLYGSFA